MLVNSFPHANTKKNMEGNFLYPGSIIKWFGHCFIDFECTQLWYPNQKFGKLLSVTKRKLFVSYDYWQRERRMFLCQVYGHSALLTNIGIFVSSSS